MKIELMIYVYIAICVSMIAYNIAYVFILNHRAKSLVTNSQKLAAAIYTEIDVLKNGGAVSVEHKNYLCKVLDFSSGITAFDKALEEVFEREPALTEKYLVDTFSVFEYLTHRYISKDTLKIAYFPYILHKYRF